MNDDHMSRWVHSHRAAIGLPQSCYSFATVPPKSCHSPTIESHFSPAKVLLQSPQFRYSLYSPATVHPQSCYSLHSPATVLLQFPVVLLQSCYSPATSCHSPAKVLHSLATVLSQSCDSLATVLQYCCSPATVPTVLIQSSQSRYSLHSPATVMLQLCHSLATVSIALRQCCYSPPQSCYNPAKVLSQSCHSPAAVLLQLWYSSATVLLQSCHNLS